MQPLRVPALLLGLAVLGHGLGFASAQAANAVDAYIADADGYNLVSLGATTFNGVSDTAGGLAIDGAFTVENNSTTLVNMMGISSGPSLYATGAFSVPTSSDTVQLNHGYAALPDAGSGWTWNSSAKTLTASGEGSLHYNSSATQDPLSQNPNWNWTSLVSDFDSASDTLYAPPPGTQTGTISVDSGGNLALTTGATSGVVVFTFNAANLSGNQYNGQTIQNFAVNVPTGLTYVINVTNLAGGSDFLSGINVNAGSNDGQLLWNFDSASDGSFTLSNGGKFYGSVLAPNLTITSDTYLEGQVVVGSLTQNQDELDDEDELGSVAIPEPPMSAWFAAAAALAGVLLLPICHRPSAQS